jgi:hypothetical protein
MSEIRDPIYGFIKLQDSELGIINSSLFQRLRRIRQLALENLVYPGAQHTRFGHSLGVLYIASIMAENLLPGQDNEEKRRIIRFAALLHDIGHGPFSHISEEVLETYSSPSESGEDTGKVHEKITRDLINHDKELSRILGPDQRSQIAGLLSGENVELSLMKETVSGPIDADKQDYLLRDSHYCGVKYGVYDLHRLLNTITDYSEGEDRHIAIKFDGINALEQFVLAKYYMTTQVYRHKIRLVTDAMIVRGIELGIERDEIAWLQKLFRYSPTEEYLENYLSWYDERLMAAIVYDSKDGFAKDIFSRLHARNLFKTVFSIKFRELPENIAPQTKALMSDIRKKENKKMLDKISGNIAKLLGTPPEFVIVNAFTLKSVKEMSRNSEGVIMIIKKDGRPSSFEQESTIFTAIDEKINDKLFEVYAPLDYLNNLDKSKKLEKIDEQILNYLSTLKEAEHEH